MAPALADALLVSAQFLRLLDPTLAQDFYADKPWALCVQLTLETTFRTFAG